MPKPKSRPLRIACVYWKTSSVGGIATHLNSLRSAAIARGDTFDILQSTDWKTKKPSKFDERQWVRGGDTNIWIDGEFSNHPTQIQDSIKFLRKNYDAIHFGFLCPHPTKAYPDPHFLPIFTDVELPKTGTITDGYWDSYAEWGELCLPHLGYVTTSGMFYADELIQRGIPVDPLGMPFVPDPRRQYASKSKQPLIVWPNQFKNIKGINHFLEAIPSLPEEVKVELYSNGIRYYQVRTEDLWLNAVGDDRFQSHNGTGRATFYGNVDLPKIQRAFQRAHFTVNLQGISTRKAAYKKGSYNNTELEALYYGAVPILFTAAANTDLPEESFRTVSTGEEIPEAVARLIKDGTALDTQRRDRARDWVMSNYSADTQYMKLRAHWL